MSKIFLASPKMVGNERKYVAEAFDSNWIAPLGPFVHRLEAGICDYVGCKGAVALSSGTAAIHLALIECGVVAGDIVFCSDLTFTASANPIRYCGATPVFVDSEPETCGMSPEALEKAFEKYTPKAVVVASIYGVPAALDKLSEICQKHNVPMIEDSTEVLGSTLNGKFAGSFGKYGTFSFNGNKIITTSGGGMLVSNDYKSLTHALHLATQAKDDSLYYEHSELGYNYRLSNVSAAIGVAQLEKIDELIGKKADIYKTYEEAFARYKDFGVQMMNVPGWCTSNYWLSVLYLGDGCYTKPEAIVGMLNRENIEARHVWKPMHTLKLWKGCDFVTTTENPHSEDFFGHAICLPSDANMTQVEQSKVIALIREHLEWCIKLYYQHGY